MINKDFESIKYRLLVGSRFINYLNRISRPSNWIAWFKTKQNIKKNNFKKSKNKIKCRKWQYSYRFYLASW